MLDRREYFVAVEKLLASVWNEHGWGYQAACILDRKNGDTTRMRFEVLRALREEGRE